MGQSKLTDLVLFARDAGAPLVAVTTGDQFAALAAICKATNGAAKVAWDAAGGVKGVNPAGEAFVKSKVGGPDEVTATTNPATALEVAAKLPEDGLFFMVNAHRFVQDPFVSTALLRLREPFKNDGRTLIALGPQFDLPMELRQDFVVLDDPLPGDKELAEVVRSVARGAKLDVADEHVQRAVDAVRGLAPFAAETVVAMSLRKSGVDVEALWDRKRAQIAQTKGVSLLAGGPSLDDIGGNAAIRDFGQRVIRGKNPPRAIYLIDEIEKYMAGSGGSDASGVTADYLGVLLREMEDNGHDGMILVSPPGCGKTMFAKALSVSHGLPCVQYDFGAMKGRYVGDSEAAIREAFKIGNGIASGRALVLATCNRLDSLPPELRRRFTSGIWYFDLPDAAERAAIWKLQIKAHGLSAPEIVAPGAITFDEGWTGAEIRNCCRIAARLDCSLVEAAGFVVPVSKSDPKSIDALRGLAEGRFLSANRPGVYTQNVHTITADTARRVRAVEAITGTAPTEN